MLNINDWRYEKKFAISSSTKHEVETVVKLHPAIFRKIFYERQVNNLYFDTLAMNNYNDNVIGTGERLKVRIRWYGDTFGRIENPVLEIKCKNGHLGGKKRIPLQPFELDENTGKNDFYSLFSSSLDESSAIKQCILSLKCSLLNNYTRSYFLSADRKFRTTIDSNLSYYRFFYNSNKFLYGYNDRFNIVLELKYDGEDDRFADQVTSIFPYLITKSSKYIKGIDCLYA